MNESNENPKVEYIDIDTLKPREKTPVIDVPPLEVVFKDPKTSEPVTTQGELVFQYY